MVTKPVPPLRRSPSIVKPPPTVSTPPIDGGQLPAPPSRPLADIWYTYIAGVGGMGVNVVASVLAQAGVRQGYEVRLTNKKGLAIRNGSVYSHLSYAPKGTPVSPLIPCGKADLLLGLDVLEAARGLEPQGRYRIAHRQHTAAIVNTAKTPTIDTLIGQEDFSAETQTDLIRQHTRQGRVLRRGSLPHLRALLGQQALCQHHDARRSLPARVALPRARHLAVGHRPCRAPRPRDQPKSL